MKLENTHILPVNERGAADRAGKVLDEGGLVVFGTESSYGIAARIDRPEALSRLSQLKARSPLSPFALVAANKKCAGNICDLPESLHLLAEQWWPGPLTLALNPKVKLHDALLSESGTVGIRVSSYEIARLVSEVGGGVVTATSANLRGESPANRVEDLSEELIRNVDLILDSGPSPGGIPSSVVGWVGEELNVFREGAISLAEMRFVLEMGLG